MKEPKFKAGDKVYVEDEGKRIDCVVICGEYHARWDEYVYDLSYVHVDKRGKSHKMLFPGMEEWAIKPCE